MNAPKIISIGEVLWDMFPDSERFGGAPANFACHVALAGGDVAMLSAVGDDSYGHEAVKILDGYEIDTRLMQVDPSASTGTVGVVLDHGGKPSYTITENTAWDSIRWSDEFDERIRQSDAVYFGTLAQRSEISRKTIRHCVGVARDHQGSVHRRHREELAVARLHLLVVAIGVAEVAQGLDQGASRSGG
jgi:fructokinase